MRLIDADKIDYIMEDDKNPSFLDYVRRPHIADEPTVKAIPIEWFKNLIKTVEDSKNYEESEILKWALNKWENQEKEKWN